MKEVKEEVKTNYTYTTANNSDFIDIDNNGNRVCSMDLAALNEAGVSKEEAQANAERICKAVNSHEELIGALKAIQIRLAAFLTEAELNFRDGEIVESIESVAAETLNRINN